MILFNLQFTKPVMRIILFILSAAITTGLCIILNTKMFLPAPLGKLLVPQEGIWQNAEPADQDFSADLKSIGSYFINIFNPT